MAHLVVSAETRVGIQVDKRPAWFTQLVGGIDERLHRLDRERMDLAMRPSWQFYPLGRIRSQESASIAPSRISALCPSFGEIAALSNVVAFADVT